MPKRTYAITDLSGKDACYLEIGGDRFHIAQFVASWACNEIPRAQCLVSLGRNAKDQKLVAQANKSSLLLRPMQRAVVYFEPAGDYNPTGITWPASRVILFEGYFAGGSYRRSNDKTAMMINLTHWLVDLACSSAVSQNSHPSNPLHLTAPAVLEQIGRVGSTDQQGAYVSNLSGFSTVQAYVNTDMWAGIKRIFCGLANVKARAAGDIENCAAATGSAVINSRAIRALKKIEGVVDSDGVDGIESCDLAYKYGVPLGLSDAGVSAVQNAVAAAVCQGTVDAYANTTFWDKLVSDFCPQFGLAVVPRVSSGLVIADTPAYNGNFWKLLRPDDYDLVDQNSAVERPLRCVSVVGTATSQLGSNAYNANTVPLHGGCYVAGSVDKDDGVIMYVAAPRWLQMLDASAFPAAQVTGLDRDVPIPTAIDPALAASARPQFDSSRNRLYVKYAQLVYVSNMLRERVGSISGRLRFDIAPGSNIKLLAKSEKFLEGEDDLAADMFANVSRVTVAINSDVGQASTSFQLTHMRFANENESPRTSVEEHALFGKQIHGFGRNGSPLIDAFDDLEGEDS